MRLCAEGLLKKNKQCTWVNKENKREHPHEGLRVVTGTHITQHKDVREVTGIHRAPSDEVQVSLMSGELVLWRGSASGAAKGVSANKRQLTTILITYFRAKIKKLHSTRTSTHDRCVKVESGDATKTFSLIKNPAVCC